MESLYKLRNKCLENQLPPHLSQKVTYEEAKIILNQNGGWMLKNTYDFDCKKKTTFYYIIKDRFGGLEEFKSKVRNQIRKSLSTYDIKLISPDDYKKIALPIYNSAQQGYHKKAKLSTQDDINAAVMDAAQRGREFWAVYKKDTSEPIALAICTIRMDEGVSSCEYNVLKCDPFYLHNSTYPYYGLIYKMNEYYLEERGISYVSDGARSITNHSNIQPFLEEKFNFRKAYCNLQVYYKPWFGFFVKTLFPFRVWIKNEKVASLLRQEAWAKGLEK